MEIEPSIKKSFRDSVAYNQMDRGEEEAEAACAEAAVRAVKRAGGKVTFDEYDREIKKEHFYAPLSWCAGWGNPTLLRQNQEKLCAFKAVKLGLLVCIDNGYALPNRED